MKIVLLGYMASGKSSIGKHLAERIHIPFIDLDMYIECKEKQTIQSIFKTKGEIYFRTIENNYLKELLNSDTGFVLSLGGGTPCYANNMNLICQSTIISIYLQASIKILVERLIKNKKSRPLIANLEDEKINEFVAKHLFERKTFYEKAMHKITIDYKDQKKITTEISTLLN